MFIIVSTSLNYKGKIIGHDCINRASTIGHEIHITRPLLLFLFCNNLISGEDIIVTKNKERFFLYSKIFKNMIEYDNLPIDIKDNEIIDITHMNALHEERYNFDFKIDLEEKYPILKNLRTNKLKIKTNIFNELISKIDYVDIDIPNDNYIVVHHRHTHYGEMDLQDGIELISNILNEYPNLYVVVFTIIDPIRFSFNSDKIKFVNRIDMYASYMNNDKCKAVLTTFSGAGQLAQFCHNKHIYYYSNGGYNIYNSNELDHNGIKQLFNISNDENNIYSYFDLKMITNANIFICNHSNNVLPFINNNHKNYLI